MKQNVFIRKLASEGLKAKDIEEQLYIQFGQQAYKIRTICKYTEYEKIQANENEQHVKPDLQIDEHLLLHIQEVISKHLFISVRSITGKLTSPATVWISYKES